MKKERIPVGSDIYNTTGHFEIVPSSSGTSVKSARSERQKQYAKPSTLRKVLPRLEETKTLAYYIAV